MTTIKQFLDDAYRLINPSNPTMPLQGNDLSFALRRLNRLITSYAADGLMLTIAATKSVPVLINQQFVTAGPPGFIPTPDLPFGRMANWENAWLILQNVTYPLEFISIDDFESSYKYEPLSAVPMYIIPYPDVQTVSFRIFPSPSQQYQFFIRGKFQLPPYVTTDDTITTLPGYYERYFEFAVAKDVALFKGRADAWTDKLEKELIKAEKIIQANSEVNLAIEAEEENMLNGAGRVRAGI